MSFTIKAMCKHGQLLHRRKTAEAALKKAREMSRTGCYDIYITTPEGRDYHSSEFADLPRTPGRRTGPSESALSPKDQYNRPRTGTNYDLIDWQRLIRSSPWPMTYPPQPFVYEGLDPVPEPKSTIEDLSDAVKGAASRVSNAIETGRKPGMPLSILSNIAREAPLGSLLVAFLLGIAVARRR